MSKVRCPICQRDMDGQRADWPQFPFCSPRCRTVDLGRWLGERYRVPDDEDDSPAEPPDDTGLPPAGRSSGRS